MKKYSLKLAKTFPSYHLRRGESTLFQGAIFNGQKIHTIRESMLWIDRVKAVNNGAAYLALEQWQGKPYRSSPEEIFALTRAGAELVTPKLIESIDLDVLAMNDGLSKLDMLRWFKASSEEDFRKKIVGKVIVHFSPYRYGLLCD